MRCCVFVIIILVLHTGTCKIKERTYRKATSIKYYTKHTDIVIPIMIHLDQSVTRVISKDARHKIRDKFKLLARDILKNVEDLFTRPNLHRKIKLQLLNVKILRNSTKKVRMDENVSRYLKSYCEWQGSKKIAKNKWFYSVLFTALDLYYLDNTGAEVRSSTGRGYMRSMCSNKHSCALLEWRPKTIAHILAHEIAHSLGIPHDGPPYNECGGQRHIMGAKYNPRNPPRTWSSCNKEALNRYLKSKQAWCLKRSSPITLYNTL